MSPHVVIIGAGYAGILAALRLSGKTRITLVNTSNTFVERIRLHQRAAQQHVVTHFIPSLLKGRHIDFVQGFVSALDADRRVITIKTEQDTRQMNYDILVYALGSTIDRDSVAGVREFAHVLSSDSVDVLHQQLMSRTQGEVLICGGGLTGIEAATEFAEAHPHLHVTLVTKGKLGETLSNNAQTYLHQTFKRLNIVLRENTGVKQIEQDFAILEDGSGIAFDVCLWAGAFSVSKLARESGLMVNERGQVLVDGQLRSLSHPEIYAIGDAAYCAEMPTRMACATALPMGAHVADNISALLNDETQKPFRFAYVGQCISLGREEGLVQMVHADDSPKDTIITGRAGAWIKEMICRFTVLALRGERLLPGLYRYPQVKYGNIRELPTHVIRDRVPDAR